MGGSLSVLLVKWSNQALHPRACFVGSEVAHMRSKFSDEANKKQGHVELILVGN